jgi:hypothetical protein
MKQVFEMVSGYMICIPNFMTIGSNTQVILRLLPKKSESISVGITDWRIYEACHWDGFMKVGWGGQKLGGGEYAYRHIDSKVISKAYL